MFRRLPYGAIYGYAPLHADTNDPEVQRGAFHKRLFRDLPEACVDYQDLAKFVFKFCEKYLEPLDTIMPFDDWIENVESYNETRREQLRQAREKCLRQFPGVYKSGHIDSFLKTERYLTFKHARQINSRTDAFKAYAGPIFKSIEKAVYQLDWFVKEESISSRVQRVERLMAGWKHYYNTDYTAFESHMTPQVLRSVECVVYSYMFQKYPDAARNIELVLAGKNRIRTRYGLSASCFGRRMSGDMCTSLGNGLTNLLIIAYVFHLKGIEFDDNAYDLIIEGDDAIIACDIELTIEDFTNVGFTIKIIEAADPRCLEFCGLVFTSSHQVVRDPQKFFSGLAWTHSFLAAGDTIMMQLLRAKCLSALAEAPDCPITSALAWYCLQKTEGYTPRFVVDYMFQRIAQDLSSPDLGRMPCPTTDTRLLFAQRYNIPLDKQMVIEQCIFRGDMHSVGLLMPPTFDIGYFSAHFLEVT
jgi:hypothetical protein